MCVTQYNGSHHPIQAIITHSVAHLLTVPGDEASCKLLLIGTAFGSLQNTLISSYVLVKNTHVHGEHIKQLKTRPFAFPAYNAYFKLTPHVVTDTFIRTSPALSPASASTPKFLYSSSTPDCCCTAIATSCRWALIRIYQTSIST